MNTKLAPWLGLLWLVACGDDTNEPDSPATAETADAGNDAELPTALDAQVLLDAQAADAATPVADASDAAPSLPSTDFAAAEALAAHGRECGVIGEGAWGAEFSPGAFCATLCFLQASCADFQRSQCTFVDELSGPLLDCLLACNDEAADFAPVAQCGDGKTVPYEALCDGKQDCAGGEDEAHCTFRCANGEIASGLGRCDGFFDCVDDSDEQGCATLCGQARTSGFAARLAR